MCTDIRFIDIHCPGCQQTKRAAWVVWDTPQKEIKKMLTRDCKCDPTKCEAVVVPVCACSV
jgi:hypothetical protein